MAAIDFDVCRIDRGIVRDIKLVPAAGEEVFSTAILPQFCLAGTGFIVEPMENDDFPVFVPLHSRDVGGDTSGNPVTSDGSGEYLFDQVLHTIASIL